MGGGPGGLQKSYDDGIKRWFATRSTFERALRGPRCSCAISCQKDVRERIEVSGLSGEAPRRSRKRLSMRIYGAAFLIPS